MLRLDFSYDDMNLPSVRETTVRASISGVQDKVQLRRGRDGFRIVERGGDYILKPVPRRTAAAAASDIPANEFLTMRIASKVFGVVTAQHDLVELSDGELAYLTKRFDRRNGRSIRQEDFCQISNRSEDTHGCSYKYDASYEELAELLRRHCPAAAVESEKVFFIILFNYVFSNGDAHLKNFSLCEGPLGDYVLAPAYDLLDTRLHFPNEPSATALEFFKDGHFTSRYEELGFYSTPDFVELGACFGVKEANVMGMISRFRERITLVEREIALSKLSTDSNAKYLAHFHDRLKAFDC